MGQILHLDQKQTDHGKRLRTALIVCDMKITVFCKKYNISTAYFYDVGSGRYALSEKMAEKIAAAVQQEGYFCTASWLLTGQGPAPCKFEDLPSADQEIGTSELTNFTSALSPDVKIMKEIAYFKKLHPESLVVGVFDDAMEPYYSLGDYVAGSLKQLDEIHTLIGKDCIVKLESEEHLIRRLGKATKPGLYNLSSTNPQTKVNNPILFDQKIVEIAPIIWHRRKAY